MHSQGACRHCLGVAGCVDAIVQETGPDPAGIQGDVVDLADLDRLSPVVEQDGHRIDMLFADAGGESLRKGSRPAVAEPEGDLVAVHGRVTGRGPKPVIVEDIFRIERGKIVEHWDVVDVVQDEVAASETARGNPMT